MMRVLFIIGIGMCCFKSSAQSNNSDHFAPVPLPPPVDTSCKKIPQKLISFTMPCCVDTIIRVRDVAKFSFDNPACPLPCGAIVFNPAVLTPSAASETQVVTATACGVTLSANVLLINPNLSTGTAPININFKNLDQSLTYALNTVLGGGMQSFQAQENMLPTGAINVATSNICCIDDPSCVKKSYKYAGAVSWNYASTGRFTVFGCPFVTSLEAVLDAKASLAINANYKTGCTTEKYCENGKNSLLLEGRIEDTFPTALVYTDLKLVAKGGLNASYCFSPISTGGSANINIDQVKVVGTVSSLWGLTSHSVSYTVLQGWTSPAVNY